MFKLSQITNHLNAMEQYMMTHAKTSQGGANGLFNKVQIRDLDRHVRGRDGRHPQASGLRELDADEVLVVAGGMMASRTTCSGGCADDCGF